jgi:hypothetical protein
MSKQRLVYAEQLKQSSAWIVAESRTAMKTVAGGEMGSVEPTDYEGDLYAIKTRRSV